MLDRFIFAITVIIVFTRGSIKLYGIASLFTGYHARHSALIRAKRVHVWLWFTDLSSHRDRLYSATDLILELRKERGDIQWA